jgi:hypothetical protein
LDSAPDIVSNGHFQCATAQIASDSLAGAWGFMQWDTCWLPTVALFAMTFLMYVALLIALKRRDPV